MSGGLERIASVFSGARRRAPGPEREAFLDEACDGDEALRHEVEGLLAHHEAADATELEPPWEGAAARVLADLTADALPETVAGYRILRRVGEGGMGTVYEALQERPRRRVALKVMRPEMATREGLRRFEREADLLARLLHPGIAQIYEQGEVDTPQGRRAFLAMEFVEGETLTGYARARDLDRDARVRLLIAVCDAVAHLHEHGVIHRDLKPGNILVTPQGEPKVLDFGVARTLDAWTIETRVGVMVGTLAYMSPEQAKGGSATADTRSDVYTLGVLAYELLAGRLPYDVEGREIPSVIRTIVEEEPRPLGALDPALRGDVSAIVGKALEKDRARRYATAADLADDLRRHAAAEPVLASPPSAFYQIRRFVRRHRALTTAVAGIAAALVLGMAFSLHFARQADRDRTRADESAGRARRATHRALLELAAANLEAAERPGLLRHLDQIPPEARGWEWRYLASRADTSLEHVSLDVERLEEARFASPPTALLVRDGGAGARLLDVHTGRPLAPPHAGDHDRSGCVGFLMDRPLIATHRRGGDERVEDVLTGEALGVDLPDLGIPAVLAGHGRRLAVAYLRGDQQFAVIHVMDAVSGELLLRFTGDVGNERALVFSPDGSLLAVGNGDMCVRLHEMEGGAQVADLRGHGGGIEALAFDDEGKRLASGAEDNTVRLWDLATQETTRGLEGHHGAVTALTFVEHGMRLASGSADTSIRLWSLAPSGAAPEVLLGHDAPVIGLTEEAGGFLLSVGQDGLRRWSLGGVGPPEVLAHHLGAEDGTRFPYVYFARFTPDGTRVVSAGWDETVRLADAATGALIATLPLGERNLPRAFALSRDGRRIVVGSLSLQLWDAELGRLLAEAGGSPRPRSPAFWCADLAPDGLLVAAGWGGDVVLLDGADLHERRRWRVPGGLVENLAFRPDGEVLATVSADGSCALYRVSDGSLVHRFRAHRGPALCVAWRPDGKRLVTGGEDKVVCVWDPETGACERRLVGHADRVWVARYAPDASRIASGSNDGTIRVWNVEHGEMMLDLRGHRRYVKDVAFSPDGATLVSASGDNTVRLWSTRSNADRWAESRAVEAAREAVTPTIRARLEGGEAPEAVLAAIEADAGLNAAHRCASRNAVLEWSARQP